MSVQPLVPSKAGRGVRETLARLLGSLRSTFSKVQVNMWGSFEAGEDEQRHPPFCAQAQ